jgi:hypothetical protein
MTLTVPTAINPFYAARHRRTVASTEAANSEVPRVQYARLPQAPINASPVPHLTSLYHFSRAGDYGDRSYPGNCGGNLIKDLLRFYNACSVLDPLCGAPHNGSSVALFVTWP